MLLAQRLKARPSTSDAAGRQEGEAPGALSRHARCAGGALLVSYHLAHQRPMMAAFLDALGIAHDNGLITEDPKGADSAEQVKRRPRRASGRVSGRGRRLYFETLLLQDPDTWAALAPLSKGCSGSQGRYRRRVDGFNVSTEDQ